MANFVVKKDGTRVAFDSEKIKTSIKLAALESGLTEEESNTIAGEVSDMVASALENQEEASTVEVREKIMSELESSHPSVAEFWKKYEESKGS